MGRLRNEYRDEWEKLGYCRTMGSAAVVRPPPSEFVRVYHITTAAYAVNDISLRRLKVARFSDLNDPFELLAVNFREARTRRVIRDFKDAFGARSGLLCFSADWTDPVLWSHYGDKHRGVCLGFNLCRDKAEPVKYEDQRIRDELRGGDPTTLSDALQQQLLCTKFSGWKYEKEWRRFMPMEETLEEGALNFFKFDCTLQLAEIVLGTHCSLNLDAVTDVARKLHPQVNVIKARLMHKDFKIVPDEDSLP